VNFGAFLAMMNCINSRLGYLLIYLLTKLCFNNSYKGKTFFRITNAIVWFCEKQTRAVLEYALMTINNSNRKYDTMFKSLVWIRA